MFLAIGFSLFVVALAEKCPENNSLPISCKQILAANEGAKSGLYDISTSIGKLQVYCDMKLEGGGFTFLPRSAASFLTVGDLENIFTERHHVMLRLQRTDGRQSYTHVQQKSVFEEHQISVQRDTHNNYQPPVNKGNLGHFLYLGFLPKTVANNRTMQGFLSNGRDIRFKNCDTNPNNYFAFFQNEDEKSPSKYHKSHTINERAKVAVSWRKSAIVLHSLHNIPIDFFFLTEIHFGGCGTYTSSERWMDCIGTAIGLR